MLGFRCGSHNLPTSANRFSPDGHIPTCTLCGSDEPGSEYHNILVCCVSVVDRAKYVNHVTEI